MRTHGLTFSLRQRASADVIVTIAARSPPNAMKSYICEIVRGRYENAGLWSLVVQ